MENIFLLALILGIFNGLSIVFNLSGIGVRNALIFGVFTGFLVGDVQLGFTVGATTLLMSIGFHTYGGATIPDYITGTIFGVIVAKEGGSIEAGLVTATALGLLMSQMDILGRATTVVFQHGGDRALANRNIKAFERWHLAGTIPWFLARFLPVFIGVLLSDQLANIVSFSNQFAWFTDGLRVVGVALPAVGFALLLSYMDLKKYWPYMLVGYVFFAYMGVNTIGLAILGAALAGLHIWFTKGEAFSMGGSE